MKTRKFWAMMAPLLLILLAAPSYGYYHPFSNRIEIRDADDHPWGGELYSIYDGGGIVQTNSITIGAPAPTIEYSRVVPFLNIVRGWNVLRSLILNGRSLTSGAVTTNVTTVNSNLIRRGN